MLLEWVEAIHAFSMTQVLKILRNMDCNPTQMPFLPVIHTAVGSSSVAIIMFITHHLLMFTLRFLNRFLRHTEFG